MDGLSIETQQQLIKEKVMSMGGELVEDIYTDEGKSGTNMKRDGLSNLLARVTKGDITHIIVQETSRLSRSLPDYLLIKTMIKKYNIEVVALSGISYSGDDPYMQSFDEMMAVFNSLQPRISGYKAKQNAIEKFKAGYFPGMAPPGYDNIINPNSTCAYDKRIVAPCSLNPFITNIFKLYATRNHSIVSLRMYLFDNGFKGRYGKPLSYSQVDNILKNPFYYGWMEWGGMEGWGKHKPLIDKETFDLVQVILADKGQYEIRKRKHNFLLRGITFCEVCGRRYTAEYHYNKKYVAGGGKLGMYHCCGLGKRGTGCKAKYITVTDLEELVRQEVAKLEFKPEFIKAVDNNMREVCEDKSYEIELAKKAAENRRDAIKVQRERIDDQLLNGHIGGEQLTRLNAKLDARMSAVQKELADINKIRTIDTSIIDEILTFTNNIVKRYTEVDNDHKRGFLHFFFKEIFIKNKQIVRITYTPAIQVLNEARLSILRAENHNPNTTTELARTIKTFEDFRLVQQIREDVEKVRPSLFPTAA
ncbi:hypothetical protein A3D79_02305 [Candidatus Daviesbacteria bacterium RIFCSPHIGHO2_02_FULL_39_8]|nr:MAG: hypothetical protein A3D79_02305 [Candidatus Daviesbacteria bacterium RIFCSPHIGHO2_02_FULL_39_8]